MHALACSILTARVSLIRLSQHLHKASRRKALKSPRVAYTGPTLRTVTVTLSKVALTCRSHNFSFFISLGGNTTQAPRTQLKAPAPIAKPKVPLAPLTLDASAHLSQGRVKT